MATDLFKRGDGGGRRIISDQKNKLLVALTKDVLAQLDLGKGG